MARKREILINQPLPEILKGLKLVSRDEKTIILELLKEKIADIARIHRGKAAFLLSEIAQAQFLSTEEIESLIIFLLKQAELNKVQPSSKRPLYLKRIGTNPLKIDNTKARAIFLMVANEIAKSQNPAMLFLVRKTVRTLKKASSTPIKIKKAAIRLLKDG